MTLLSVIVPVYNEAKTIRQILEKINSVSIDKEIIVVDDGSSDGTNKILRDIKYDNLTVIYHGTNRGKGSAFLTGLTNAKGDFIIVQDADLEYDPKDYLKLMQEIKLGNVDLVLGVRFTKGYSGLLIPRLGNRFLSIFMNFLFRAQLNDFLTCYKLMKRDSLISLNLESKKFEIDTEIIAKSIKKHFRIKQVPVSYYPRTYGEGKKIRILDGIRAIVGIIKYRFLY